jgi:hypothetical protein
MGATGHGWCSENIVEASWNSMVDSIDYKLFKEEAKKAKKARGKNGKSA